MVFRVTWLSLYLYPIYSDRPFDDAFAASIAPVFNSSLEFDQALIGCIYSRISSLVIIVG